MRSVRTSSGGCHAPFEGCVQIQQVKTPRPNFDEVLIRVNATSVNPSDVDTVEMGGCVHGCGADVSGTVVEAPPRFSKLHPGDQVWTLAQPAYADYVISKIGSTALKPASMSHHDAATIPEVGLTSLFSLKRTASDPADPLPPPGSPWGSKSNLHPSTDTSGCRLGADPTSGNPYVNGCGEAPLPPGEPKASSS